MHYLPNFTFSILSTSFYKSHSTRTFTQFIDQLMEPVSLLILLMHTICWIVGGGFLLGAIVRYMQHRSNPGQTPLNQPFFLSCLGLVFISLPFVTRHAL